MNKKKLLILTSTYPRWHDDVEPAFVHDLSKRLCDDFEVHVLAPHFPGAAKFEEMDSVQVHRFQYWFAGAQTLAYQGGIPSNLSKKSWLYLLLPFFLLSELVSGWLIIRKHNIDTIHAHWVIPQGVIGLLLKMLTRRNLVITSHGSDVSAFDGKLARRFKSWVYRGADAVTVVSTALAEKVMAISQRQDINVAPMGVDMSERFVPPATPVNNSSNLIFVGRLVESKGVGTLLQAFSLLAENYPELKLSILGDGPNKRVLVNQVKTLGLDPRVVFHGSVSQDQLPAYYHQASIAILPSKSEGLGLVVVEALACGCAVIASDLPAIKDVITHKESGLLFETDNAEALANCIDMLLQDTELATRLAASGRKMAVDKFSWPVSAARYKQLFSNLS